MSTPKKTIKIFVSSPTDVAEERLVAKRVIERLAWQFSYSGHIELVLSEEKALPATDTPQRNIPAPSATDIVVVLLWSRLGTPIPDDRFRARPGDPPMTGTEWEFYDAAMSFRQSGRPFLLVYRKRAKVLVDRDDEAELTHSLEQKNMLKAFERRWFRDDEGSWKGYYHSFLTTAEFEKLLEQHLHERLSYELADITRSDDPVVARQWPDSPFRGLAVFDVAHSPIFFGRVKALSELRTKLKDQIAQGIAFVLVTGASGAGKSSLVRAGLVASLLDDPTLVADNGLVRCAIFRPSDATQGFGEALVRRLSAPDALPELHALGFDPLALPERFCTAIEEALTQAERGASLPSHFHGRLVLVIDQLEELLTGRIARDEANRFIELIDRLACSGRVWVIATLRGDFFSHLDDFPKLSELAETGLFRLAGPQPAEIAQMIRKPAELAAVRFERHRDTDVPLDSLILEEAARDAASLPLLEFMLDELWRRRTAEGLISYEEYERLGGLSGGVARRAEDVAAELEKSGGPDAATIDAVLETLVTVAKPDAEATAARVSQAEVANTPERARVIDCLIKDRLVVIDVTPGEAEPMVRLVHEQLIQHWPRLVRIVTEGRRFLVTRARLKSDAAAWAQAGEPDDLLISSPRRLESGGDLLATKRDHLDLTTVRFIECSLTAADARRTRETEREQERLQLELKRQQAENALQAAALRTTRWRFWGLLAASLLVLVGGALLATNYVDKREINEQIIKGDADALVFRVKEVFSNVKGGGLQTIQRVASQAEQEIHDLTKLAPKNLDVQRRQAEVWEHIGDAKLEENDAAGAVAAYEEGQKIRRDLVTRSIEPQKDLARRYLASNLMKRGDGLKDRDEAGALGAYEEARTIASDLAKKHADNIEWQLDVPTLWGRIGTLKWRAGDRQAAISSFDKALESSQRVAATAQKDQINYCRCHTATLLNIIGELKEESNEWTGALKAYEQAYEVLSDLYKDEPTTWWQRSKLLTLLSILNAKLGAGDVNGARRAYEESRTIAIQLDLQRGWAKQIRDNFEKLRQKGIVHPYMDEVEGVLKPPSFKRRR